MEPNIKDYAHLYLGCEMRMYNAVALYWSKWRRLTAWDLTLILNHDKVVQFALRPLSSMSDEELNEYEATRKVIKASPVHQIGVVVDTHESTRYLLSKHFDLFGLIAAGIAIDKTTLKV